MNNVKRLEYLGNKFKLYCNRYHATINTGLSHRFMKWIDEYHNIKENDRDAWNEYCDKYDLDRSHDAYDCFA